MAPLATRIISGLKFTGNLLLDFLFPRICLLCERMLLEEEKFLCLPCFETLPFVKEILNESPSFRLFMGRAPVSWASSLLWFSEKGPVQKIVHHIKYDGNRHLALWLGSVMASHVPDFVRKSTPVLLPVPLHPSRERKRGFNQAEELARGIASVMGLPIARNLVVRVKHTKSQTTLSLAQRQENMKGAFSIKPSAAESLKKITSLMIIDDVLTTGTTILELITTLLSAGFNGSIFVYTLAISAEPI